jgi:hypothetical protein
LGWFPFGINFRLNADNLIVVRKFGKSSSVCPFKFSAENKLSSFLQKITLSRKATRTVSQSQQQIVCSAESEGLRNGCATDADMIRKMIQEEKMNPLFLDPSNFVVAEQVKSDYLISSPPSAPSFTWLQDGEVLGFGQIRSQGSEFELSSLVVRKDMRGMVICWDSESNSSHECFISPFLGQGIGTAIVNELLKVSPTHTTESLICERHPYMYGSGNVAMHFPRCVDPFALSRLPRAGGSVTRSASAARRTARPGGPGSPRCCC